MRSKTGNAWKMGCLLEFDGFVGGGVEWKIGGSGGVGCCRERCRGTVVSIVPGVATLINSTVVNDLQITHYRDDSESPTAGARRIRRLDPCREGEAVFSCTLGV